MACLCMIIISSIFQGKACTFSVLLPQSLVEVPNSYYLLNNYLLIELINLSHQAILLSEGLEGCSQGLIFWHIPNLYYVKLYVKKGPMYLPQEELKVLGILL